MIKGQREIALKVKEISDELLSRMVDLVLVSLYFGLEFSSAGYGKGWKAGEKVSTDLEEFNYETIKRCLSHLKKKGLIETAKGRIFLSKITQEGRKRLKSLLPEYRKERTWDGRIYLVTYDLPVKRNSDRNKLREYLKKIGCGMLQESVWITPYNPKELIEEFVEKTNLDAELILVSSSGKDGTVGNMDLSDLLDKVYKLGELNARYMEFIAKVDKKEIGSKDEIAFFYLSILRDDPQLPFQLLPRGWLGDEAYRLFEKSIQANNARA